jgi:hypothetical protein
LHQIHVPRHVCILGSSWLSGCLNLRAVVFHDESGLRVISPTVFLGNGIANISLPDCVGEFGSNSFAAGDWLINFRFRVRRIVTLVSRSILGIRIKN